MIVGILLTTRRVVFFLALLPMLSGTAISAAHSPGNLLRNPGAEAGFDHWTIGGTADHRPTVDPVTDIPHPANRTGAHRFGISIGWQGAETWQYQTVEVDPGRDYLAGFWATHANGTDERARLFWCAGDFGGREHLITETRLPAQSVWTHHAGTFTPTGDRITLILRYFHLRPTDIASFHVDDLHLYALPLPADAPDIPADYTVSEPGIAAVIADSTGPDGIRTLTAEITHGQSAYRFDAGGSLDEFNTHRYGRKRWSGYIVDYQPNRRVLLENIGDRTVEDITLVANDRRRWFTMEDLREEIFSGWATEEEKTYALWNWCRSHIWSGPTVDVLWPPNRSVVRFMNSFGRGACGTYNLVMPLLGQAGGLEAYIGCQGGCAHATQKERWGGEDRYFDCMLPHGGGGQPQGHFFLDYDNRTVVGPERAAKDRFLMQRVAGDDSYLAWSPLFGDHSSYWLTEAWTEPLDMRATLRPGERLIQTWTAPETMWGGEDGLQGTNAQGMFVWEPRLVRDHLTTVAQGMDHLAFPAPGSIAAENGNRGTLDLEMNSPWVFIGGRIQATATLPEGAERLAVQYTFDGITWPTVWESSESGSHTINADISADGYFHKPHLSHRFIVRFLMEGTNGPSGTFSHITLTGRFQTYVPSLPALQAGPNHIAYRDNSNERRIRVTHEWLQSEESMPVRVATEPVSPANGAAAPFNTTFAWSAADHNTADVQEWEFYLSPRADLAWPLLAPFHAVIPRPTATFQPGFPNAFNHGQTYFWRVRARNGDGMWGPWSETWSFTAQGPGLVTDVAVEEATGQLWLTWQAPSNGTDVDHYEIHSSQEPGFMPFSNTVLLPYPGPEPRPVGPTLLTTTTDTQFPIGFHPFYRVIAVDAAGSRGTPSRYAAAPHPRLLEARYLSEGAEIPVRESAGLWCYDEKINLFAKGKDEFQVVVLEGPEGLELQTSEYGTSVIVNAPTDPGVYPIKVAIQQDGTIIDQRKYHVRGGVR